MAEKQLYRLEEVVDPAAKTSICAEVLSDLPDWFGVPESTAAYVRGCAEYPFWAAYDGSSAVGFVVLRQTGNKTAEIWVMGVKRAYHRAGLGRKLFSQLFTYAAAHGYAFLQVKTVREGCYDSYDRTNQFYKSLGFVEFECFPTLWDEKNPCQILIMDVKP